MCLITIKRGREKRIKVELSNVVITRSYGSIEFQAEFEVKNFSRSTGKGILRVTLIFIFRICRTGIRFARDTFGN